MKVLHHLRLSGPKPVSDSWGKVFQAIGWQFAYWDDTRKSAFDAFGEYEPNLYIGETFGLDEAVIKCIKNRPHMRVVLYASAWGDLINQMDLEKYPIVAINDAEKVKLEKLKKETGKPDLVWLHLTDNYLEPVLGGWRSIGIEPIGLLNAGDAYLYVSGRYRPELASDANYVGGKWPFKSRNIDRYLVPLLNPSKGLNIKIWGNQGWAGFPQYVGYADDYQVPDILHSAKVCPNVHEPHSTDFGFDAVERIYKAPLAGGCVVSDYVECINEVFGEGVLPMAKSPAEYEQLVRYYIEDGEARRQKILETREIVVREHTYHHRIMKLLATLGYHDDAARVKKRLTDLFGTESFH